MLSCSKSGYYDWVNLGRPKYKAFNESYNQLVLDTYTKNNTWGIRSVRMKIKEFYGISLKNSTIQRYNYDIIKQLFSYFNNIFRRKCIIYS